MKTKTNLNKGSRVSRSPSRPETTDKSNFPPGMNFEFKQDQTGVYSFADGTKQLSNTLSGDLGGRTLVPGVYKSLSTIRIQTGDLTLDAQGNENAFWVFQIAADLTTIGGEGGNVVLRRGAQAKNIFWQTGGLATIGENTSFKGSILNSAPRAINIRATSLGPIFTHSGSTILPPTQPLLLHLTS